MLCPRCLGKHVVLVGSGWVPCPECGGLGELHCCDGLREQGCAADAPRQAIRPKPTHSPDGLT